MLFLLVCFTNAEVIEELIISIRGSVNPVQDEQEQNPHKQEQKAETQDLESLARLFTMPREPMVLLIRALMDLVFNIKVEGLENMPGEGGGILICNHTDLIDVPVQAVYTPRTLIYLGKAELFEPGEEISKFLYQEGSPLNLPGISMARPMIEQALKTYSFAQRAQFLEWGAHPIIRNHRGDSARDSVQYYADLEEYMVKLVQAGHILAIFPEGTRTETGVLGPFRAMAAKLAIRAKVPIIPSGISGSFGFLSAKSLFSGRMFQGQITYNMGQPIQPEDFPEGDEKKAAKELTAILEKQVYALTMHPERREHSRGKARVL